MKRNPLKNAFNIATAGLGAAPLALLANSFVKSMWRQSETLFPSHSEASFTDGEKAFVESIFGEKVKTGRVKKYFSSVHHDKGKAQTIGREKIKFYGDEYGSADYSRADIYKFGLFIHEMAHIWQNQHALSNCYQGLRHLDINQEYHYQLSPQSRFKDFGKEQQAAIIEDYARQFLYRGSDAPRERTRWLIGGANEGSLMLLQKVVEDKFPAARKTRLALEAPKNYTAKPFSKMG
jgi:hypothetical protein